MEYLRETEEKERKREKENGKERILSSMIV